MDRVDPPPEPYDTERCQEIGIAAVKPTLRRVLDILREVQGEFEAAYCNMAMAQRLRHRVFDEIELSDPDRFCPQIAAAIKELAEALS